MDDQVAPQSEYLQNLIRERKAESARIPPHASPASLQPARDDNIFDNQGILDPLNRRRNPHLAQSSPMAPPSNNGSRSTATKSTTSSQPRAIGAREMDAHVDKLSKENFDLKLELYYRKEKIDELERRLENVQQLEEDAAELVGVNQDLCVELEKRDRAIDEAVVMICDLEDKIRRLEEQYMSDTRPSSLTIGTSASTNTSALLQEPPIKVATGTIPAETEAIQQSGQQLAANTEDPKARAKPSFIDSEKPATNALRSMFVHDGRQIRPIPSATSLASGVETRDDDYLDEPPRSPGLSELSESDFKSIYGRTTPKPNTAPTLDDLPDSPAESPVVVIPRERKLARTNQWVHERAISPVQPARRTSAGAHDQFQSLGGALQREVEHPPRPASPSLSRKQPLRFNPAEGQAPDPRLDLPFNRNMYPPTPDTLATRKLSHRSSSSIIQDKSFTEGVAVADTHAQFSRYLESQAQADRRNDDLAAHFPTHQRSQSRDLDYDDLDAQDFGASLFRHDGYAREAASMPSRFNPSHRANMPASNVYRSVQPEQSSTPRRRTQHARPNSIHMTNTPTTATRVTDTLPPTLASELASEKQLHRSISLSPTPSSHTGMAGAGTTFQNNRLSQLSPAPAVPAHRTPPKQPSFTPAPRATGNGSTQASRASELPPTLTSSLDGAADQIPSRPSTAVPASSVADGEPPKFASALRNRMARLTHRTSPAISTATLPTTSDVKVLPPIPTASRNSNTAPSPSVTMTTNTPAPRENVTLESTTPTPSRRHSRSASATRRFFTQHRRRSSATPSSPTSAARRPVSKNGPDNQILRPMGSDTSEESARLSRTAAFLTAATAAAPYLSFDINKSAKPIPGVGAAAAVATSGIPMVNPASTEPAQAAGQTARQRRGSAGLAGLAGRVGASEKRRSLNLAGYDPSSPGVWRP